MNNGGSAAAQNTEIEAKIVIYSALVPCSKFGLSHFTRDGHVQSYALKHFIIKTYKELILYKPVGKYQFTMACIRALVMIVYQVINCLISQPKHMLWVLKRTVAMRPFF